MCGSHGCSRSRCSPRSASASRRDSSTDAPAFRPCRSCWLAILVAFAVWGIATGPDRARRFHPAPRHRRHSVLDRPRTAAHAAPRLRPHRWPPGHGADRCGALPWWLCRACPALHPRCAWMSPSLSRSPDGRARGRARLAALLLLAVALAAGCGGARQPASAIPRSLLLQTRPIGEGAAFHPPPAGTVVGACTPHLGARYAGARRGVRRQPRRDRRRRDRRSRRP